MFRDIWRRFVTRTRPPADAIAALDGGPGPEPVRYAEGGVLPCGEPVVREGGCHTGGLPPGLRMVRLPDDDGEEAAAARRYAVAALANTPGATRATIHLSFCRFDDDGRCEVHENCHLPQPAELLDRPHRWSAP